MARLIVTERIKDALGKELANNYDKAGNMTSQINANNYTVTYSYDKLNRLETVTDAYNKIINKKIYDANGNFVKEIDAKGYLSGTIHETRYGTVYTYDMGNRITSDNELY